MAAPRQIVFDLDAAESVQIRRSLFGANGGRLLMPVYAVNGLLVIAQAALRLYRHDVIGWVFLGLAIIYLSLLVPLTAGWWGWQRSFIKLHTATVVSFGEAGLDIERGNAPAKRVKQFVPFKAIRSVQMRPDALIILGRLGPIAIVPKRALGLDGDRIMKYFEAHLIGTRALQRSSTSATLIVNTTSS